ncbi:hypothetical protein Vafri_2179 [Volvox africanus]|nr:hypothetical protein Vafri_2179 [Volvox africanus]
MLGGGGSLEPRLRAVTAASSAAVKAAKRAHLAAALAVQSAVPPRPRSRYFTRNRSDRTGFSKRFGSRKVGKDKEDGSEKGTGENEESVRRRSSEDSTSSVSRSITSSGVSSDYTTEDDSSDYVTDEDEDDEDEDDEKEEEEGEHQASAAVTPKASGAGPIASSPERQQAPPPRIGAVAAAIEAVAAARARLRQPSQLSSTANCPTGSTTTAGGGAGTGHGGARRSAADSQHLPPVVPRNKGGADGPHPITTTVTAANFDSKLPEAGSGGLSALRLLASTMQLQKSSPMAATASRRSALLTVGPSGNGLAGTAPAAAGVGCGATPSGGGIVAGDRDRNGSLADWVAQRFRSGSRLAMHADAGTSTPLPRSLPGSSGSVGSSIGSSNGDASSGLRGLLAARSDGVASWYSRPARWHDPVTPGGASQTSLLDLRPPVHGSAASSVFVAPVSLASPLMEHQRKKDGLAREVV